MHSRLCAFLGLFQGRNHRPSHLNLGKPSKNHRFQWLLCKKNIQWWWSRDGKTIEKPFIAMAPWKKNITIPSLQKNDHLWSLMCSNQLEHCCFLEIWFSKVMNLQAWIWLFSSIWVKNRQGRQQSKCLQKFFKKSENLFIPVHLLALLLISAFYRLNNRSPVGEHPI